GYLRALAIDPGDPSHVFVGGFGGLLRSTDAGATWEIVLDLNAIVVAVAVAPSDPSVVYASAPNAGVYRSTSGGDFGTWVRVDDGLPRVGVFSLAVDPAASGTVYAGTDGVYKTVDSGGTWMPARDGLGFAEVDAVGIDPTAPSVIYAGGLRYTDSERTS